MVTLDLKNGLRIAAFGAVLMCSSVAYAQEGEGAVIQNAEQLSEAELQAAIQNAVDAGATPEQIATILTQSGVDAATATSAMNNAGIQNAAAAVTTAAAQAPVQARTVTAPANSSASSEGASGVVVAANGLAVNVRTTQDLAQAALTNFANNVRNTPSLATSGNSIARTAVTNTIVQNVPGITQQQTNEIVNAAQQNPTQVQPTPVPIVPTPPPETSSPS